MRLPKPHPPAADGRASFDLAEVEGHAWTSGPIRVLVAYGEPKTRSRIRRRLENDPRFEICGEAGHAAVAVDAALRHKPGICLLGANLQGDGFAAAWEIGSRLPLTRVVMLCDEACEDDLVSALRVGAAGLLTPEVSRRLPETLLDVHEGVVVIPRALVAAIVGYFRLYEPRRRALAGGELGGRLTSRQWEVLELLTRELSTAEIAERLVISKSAVRAHVSAIVKRLGVADRTAAVALFRAGAEGHAAAPRPTRRLAT